MDVALYDIVPIVAALSFIVFGVSQAGAAPHPGKGWKIAAALSALFLAWSLFAVWREGPLGFWAQHVQDAWGVQIWLDLLLGVGLAVALLFPRARAVGMRPLPWFLLVACTGSVGLLAMLARCLFLEERAALKPVQGS